MPTRPATAGRANCRSDQAGLSAAALRDGVEETGSESDQAARSQLSAEPIAVHQVAQPADVVGVGEGEGDLRKRSDHRRQNDARLQ